MNWDYYKEERRCIRKAKNDRKLVIFVGSGASKPSGMPLWTEAVDIFNERLKSKRDSNTDTLKIPQMYYNARGEKEYVETAQEIFKYQKKLFPTEIHNNLLKFEAHTIITTNYDTLIEDAAEKQGDFYQVISQDKDIPYKTSQKEIIKMHGDFQHGNFVLKEDDYTNYSKNFQLMEVYIKSLIASNTLLFVGYSFSDPDLRQMFHWVKDILGKDFQRAYMIESFHEYDESEFDYYKNLGINIIYSSKIFGNQKSEWQNKDNDILNYILKDDKAENEIDEIYRKLAPLNALNFIQNKYVNQIFRRYRINIENGIMQAFDPQDELANKILLSLMTDDKLEQTVILRNILSKCGISKINTINQELKVKNYELSKNKTTELDKAIRRFDRDSVKKFIDYYEMEIAQDDPDQLLQLSYGYYLIEKYIDAYKYLRKAAAIFYQKNNFVWFFICEFNKTLLNRILQSDFQFDRKIVERIGKEVDQIDLDKLYLQLPVIENDFIRDIYMMQISQTMLREISRDSKKTKEEAETKYFMYSGVASYKKMQEKLNNYYRYLTNNYLMVDKFTENHEIFYTYVETLLSSIASDDLEGDDNSCFGKSANIHANCITEFDMFIIIAYISQDELTRLFRRYHIDVIPHKIENDVMNIIIDNVIKNEKESKRTYDRLYVLIELLSKMDIPVVVFNKIIACMKDKSIMEIIVSRRNTMLNFIIRQYKRGNITVENKEIKELFISILEQLEQIKSNEVKNYLMVLRNIVEVVYKLYTVVDDIRLDVIIESEMDPIVLANIFRICAEKNKKTIKQKLEKELIHTKKINTSLYHDAILNNILEPNADYENAILRNLEQLKTQDMTEYSDYWEVINELINLYLSRKIINEEEVKKKVTESEDEVAKFFMNMENYDYSKFKISWLSRCSPNLLKEMSENEKIASGIRKAYVDQYPIDKVQEIELKNYFKYFALK